MRVLHAFRFVEFRCLPTPAWRSTPSLRRAQPGEQPAAATWGGRAQAEWARTAPLFWWQVTLRGETDSAAATYAADASYVEPPKAYQEAAEEAEEAEEVEEAEEEKEEEEAQDQEGTAAPGDRPTLLVAAVQPSS